MLDIAQLVLEVAGKHMLKISGPFWGSSRSVLGGGYRLGKPGETLRLDIDPKSHPAWTGVQRVMDTGGQVAKFNKKFASIGQRKK